MARLAAPGWRSPRAEWQSQARKQPAARAAEAMTDEPVIGRLPPAAGWRPRHDAAILLLVGLVAAGGYFWGIAGFRREHARHQIRAELRRIEESLRAGTGIAFWMYVEAEDSDRTDPGEHARHKAILGDFDRLAHLEGLSFAGVEVDVRGDDAVARFRVSGKSRDRDSAPGRAELTFRRSPKGWRLSGSRLLER